MLRKVFKNDENIFKNLDIEETFSSKLKKKHFPLFRWSYLSVSIQILKSTKSLNQLLNKNIIPKTSDNDLKHCAVKHWHLRKLQLYANL